MCITPISVALVLDRGLEKRDRAKGWKGTVLRSKDLSGLKSGKEGNGANTGSNRGN